MSNGNARPAYRPLEIEHMLRHLDPVDFRDYGRRFLPLAMAVHEASGGLALDEFIAWAARDPKYPDASESIRDKWNRFKLGKAGNVTCGTLHKFLRDAGHADKIIKPWQGGSDE